MARPKTAETGPTANSQYGTKVDLTLSVVRSQRFCDLYVLRLVCSTIQYFVNDIMVLVL